MSHLYIKTDTVKGWREAMADWDSGGEAALAEMDEALDGEAEAAGHTLAALSAIYHDAHRRGYRTGFEMGVAEKLWLHRHWPAIGMLTGAVMLILGIFMGVQA